MTEQNRFSPPHRPTIADVAKAAGVSRTTVSHALNDRGVVDARTREKVKTIAAQLGYRPNLRAQRLRTGRTNCIALISSMPVAVAGGPSRLGFMMEIAGIVAEHALRHGSALVLVPPLPEADQLVDELDIDGALLLEPVADDPLMQRLAQRGVNVVSIGRPAGEQMTPHVTMHTSVGEMLLQHLAGQGAKRVALLIGQQARYSYQEMERAYRDFCQQQQTPCLLMKADEAEGEAAGRWACQQLLTAYPDIDAICAPVDAFAVGVAAQLQEMGKQIPQDVMLVTRYDGLRARQCQPPLTALNLHLEQVAEQAVTLLFEHINGDHQHIEVRGPAPELVVRQSSQG